MFLKSTKILVFMILNAKVSNWLWSIWEQSCFHSLLTGKSNEGVCI